MRQPPRAFELRTTFAHLGLGSVVLSLPGFNWSPEYMERYSAETELDGDEGRLVSLLAHTADWTTWERHPGGDELVVVVSGRLRIIQELANSGEEALNVLELAPGQAVINPRDLWHTADVLEAGDALYITPGIGTQHRLRAA
jgi:mannose-6-phosphate isomerase-like protein (cupin superfamily)